MKTLTIWPTTTFIVLVCRTKFQKSPDFSETLRVPRNIRHIRRLPGLMQRFFTSLEIEPVTGFYNNTWKRVQKVLPSGG
jgi:hypothetical protein